MVLDVSEGFRQSILKERGRTFYRILRVFGFQLVFWWLFIGFLLAFWKKEVFEHKRIT